MDFYESISPYYDEIFPASPEAIAFLGARCPARCRILDAACGTGSHAMGLAATGHEVIGVDLDETMIDKARKKNKPAGTRFLAGNMLDIEKLFSGERAFDLIYCIGNSLVHLANEEQVLLFLKAAHALLTPKGRVVVQIVSFDNIIGKGIRQLPDLITQDGSVSFRRRYEYQPKDATVQFVSTLSVSGEKGKTATNAVALLILRKKRLEELTLQAGLHDCLFYGSFREDPVDRDSFPLILTAAK